MQRAIIVASNSTAGIAAVAANFEKLQVRLGTQTYVNAETRCTNQGRPQQLCSVHLQSTFQSAWRWCLAPDC